MEAWLNQRLWAYSDWLLPIFDDVYRGMNLVEGTAWLVFSGLVLVRFIRFRHTWLEVAYSISFFTFGLTDYWEAVVVQPWLILVKGSISSRSFFSVERSFDDSTRQVAFIEHPSGRDQDRSILPAWNTLGGHLLSCCRSHKRMIFGIMEQYRSC